MIVFPESGPTSLSNSRKSCTLALASFSVVRKPSTTAPMPTERAAAATGPVGRSISSSWLVISVSVIWPSSRDWSRLRDQGAEEARDGRSRERAGEDNQDKGPGGAIPGQ